MGGIWNQTKGSRTVTGTASPLVALQTKVPSEDWDLSTHAYSADWTLVLMHKMMGDMRSEMHDISLGWVLWVWDGDRVRWCNEMSSIESCV